MDKVHQQGIKADDLDIRDVAKNLPSHVDPVVQGEARLFRRAFGDCQDQAIEQAGGTVHEVFVTPGDRVEGAWIDRYAMIEFVQTASRRISW